MPSQARHGHGSASRRKRGPWDAWDARRGGTYNVRDGVVRHERAFDLVRLEPLNDAPCHADCVVRGTRGVGGRGEAAAQGKRSASVGDAKRCVR